MYRIGKTIKWEAAHILHGLPPGHVCGNMHGHSYRADIVLAASKLDEVGFVVDFNVLKLLKDALDHKVLNDVMGPKRNPTAENIARWIAEKINEFLFKLDAHKDVTVESVTVWETETCWAEYTTTE